MHFKERKSWFLGTLAYNADFPIRITLKSTAQKTLQNRNCRLYGVLFKRAPLSSREMGYGSGKAFEVHREEARGHGDSRFAQE